MVEITSGVHGVHENDGAVSEIKSDRQRFHDEIVQLLPIRLDPVYEMSRRSQNET